MQILWKTPILLTALGLFGPGCSPDDATPAGDVDATTAGDPDAGNGPDDEDAGEGPDDIEGEHAFVDVRVLDVETGEVVPDRVVVVAEGRIAYIGATDSVRLSESTERIDGQGRYLVPGLSEMHGHPSSKEDLMLHIATGVTTLRAMWGEPILLDLRERAGQGEFVAPRLHLAGPIVDGPPIVHFGTAELSDPADADALVARQQAAGYDFVKVYENMTPPVFDALIAAATARGMEVSGHVPQAVPLRAAAEAGMKTTEHLFGYLAGLDMAANMAELDRWNSDPAAIALLESVGRGEVDIDDVIPAARIDELAETLSMTGTWTVPTLKVVRGVSGADDYDRALLQYVRPAVGLFWSFYEADRAMNQSAEYFAGWQALYGAEQTIVKRLHDAGAGLLIGTDAGNPGVIAGFSVVDEMENLVAAGLSRVDVLRIAMHAPAVYLGRTDEFGAVREGLVADLLLLDGDPREGFDVLRQPAGVMRAGAWLDRAALDELLARISVTYGEWMLPFADLPEAPGGLPVTAMLSRGSEAHIALTPSFNGSSFGFFKGPGADGWGEVVMEFGDPLASSLVRPVGDAVQVVEVDDAGDRTTLVVDGEEVATGPTGALLLSGTPLDLAALDAAFAELEIGDEATVEAWLCRPMAPCEGDVVRWTVTRMEDEAPVGSFYFTGSKVYALRGEDGAFEGRVWIGGGAFYSGQPVQAELGEGLWLRRL